MQAKAAKTGKFDYDAPFPGLEVVDRYTLKIRLKAPDLRFPYVLAISNTAAIAREVVDAYGNDIGAHPVGTGPYMLGAYKRSSRIELVANPGFRDVTYAPTGPIPASSQSVAADLKGKKLPRSPRIDISIIEEAQARWLAFLNGEIDLHRHPAPRFHAIRHSRTERSGPSSRQRASRITSSFGRTCISRSSTWRTRCWAATRRRRSRCGARSAWATTSPS